MRHGHTKNVHPRSKLKLSHRATVFWDKGRLCTAPTEQAPAETSGEHCWATDFVVSNGEADREAFSSYPWGRAS